jgi:hypothetical protein
MSLLNNITFPDAKQVDNKQRQFKICKGIDKNSAVALSQLIEIKGGTSYKQVSFIINHLIEF